METYRSCLVVVFAVVSSVHSGLASATAQRTFVASNGNDAGPCSIGQPCRSFAAAVANTNVNGEVIVLDSAGYGKVTITQAVSIIAPPGIYAGISVFSGDDGITVNAGANDKVTLRGLVVNGQGGSRGIMFLGGAQLEIDRCVVSGMTADGIEVGSGAGMTTITETVVERNGNTGIRFLDRSSGISTGLLTSVRVSNNGDKGLLIGAGAQVQVRTSVFNQNPNGGVRADAIVTGNPTVLDITRSLLSGNGSRGIALVTESVGAFVQAVIADNVITDHSEAGIGAITTSGFSGGVHAVLTRNAVRGSAGASGILVGSSSNIEFVLDGNVVSQTSVGVSIGLGAIVHSRGDNVVDDNTTNKSGAVTAANVL